MRTSKYLGICYCDGSKTLRQRNVWDVMKQENCKQRPSSECGPLVNFCQVESNRQVQMDRLPYSKCSPRRSFTAAGLLGVMECPAPDGCHRAFRRGCWTRRIIGHTALSVAIQGIRPAASTGCIIGAASSHHQPLTFTRWTLVRCFFAGHNIFSKKEKIKAHFLFSLVEP